MLNVEKARELFDFDWSCRKLRWRVDGHPNSQIKAGDVARVVCGQDGLSVIRIAGKEASHMRLVLMVVDGRESPNGLHGKAPADRYLNIIDPMVEKDRLI